MPDTSFAQFDEEQGMVPAGCAWRRGTGTGWAAAPLARLRNEGTALNTLTRAGEWSSPLWVLFQSSQPNKPISTQCLEPFGSRLKVFIGSS